MQKQKIEIDQEVFEFLKSQAEPFVETPNDVLRRLLLNKQISSQVMQDSPYKKSINNPPSVQAGTPKALEHILQVIYLAHFQNISRSKATKRVAEIHDVASQTVLDKYCRQLNLSASEFDKLLSESDLSNLKSILYSKFHEHRETIDSYLKL